MRAVLVAFASALLASCGSAQTPSPSPTALGEPLVFYPPTGVCGGPLPGSEYSRGSSTNESLPCAGNYWTHYGFNEQSNVAALNGGSCIFSSDDLNATFSAPSDQTNGSVTSVDITYRASLPAAVGRGGASP